jgi:hypothetical protein
LHLLRGLVQLLEQRLCFVAEVLLHDRSCPNGARRDYVFRGRGVEGNCRPFYRGCVAGWVAGAVAVSSACSSAR